MKAGESVSPELFFPDNFGIPTLAGRKAKVELRVVAVQESRLPEVDDKFIASFGVREGGLERFRQDVRQNLERELGNMLNIRNKNEVVSFNDVSSDVSSMLELSDEQLLAYLDAAGDRRTRTARDGFESRVEAARLGTVFASNAKAYGSWRRKQDRQSPERQPVLVGAALESAVMNIARQFPGHVVSA